MSEKINWEDFASPYWSPTKGEQHRLVLANWRQATRTYDEDKNTKNVIEFDVLRVDNEEYMIGNKIFVTGAFSFVNDVKPIIISAEARGHNHIHIQLRYGKDKKYMILDLYEPNKEYVGLKK